MTRKWGSASAWVLRYLLERDGSVCYLCNKESDEKGSKTLWIEHMDNNADNHDPSNLRLAHPSCNQKKNPPHQDPLQQFPDSVRANELAWGPGGKAGAKSEQMLPLYRRAMYNTQTGLFRNAGQIYPKMWVAGIMQEELVQIGTATTFLKYIGADVNAGYLQEKEMIVDADDPKKARMRTVLERTLKPYPEEKLR